MPVAAVTVRVRVGVAGSVTEGVHHRNKLTVPVTSHGPGDSPTPIKFRLAAAAAAAAAAARAAT